MLPRRVLLCAAAALLCLSASCLAQEFKATYSKFKDVPGAAKGEDGQWFIEVGEESTKHYVVKDPDTKLLFFVNTETNAVQWHDPRGPDPSSTEPDTLNINIPFSPPPAAKTSGITVAVIAMLPLLLFAGGTAARVAYLQLYYPELLWPTKERKDRRKAAGGKLKPQKQRGKMNQDGKGGRSANS